jgi:putative FmdB family regulatory protein
MPTYEYACKSCGEHLEVVQSFKDDALTECPNCGGPLRKVFGSIGIAFKGSGFYKNDSRTAAGNGKSESSRTKGTDGSKSESGPSSDSSSGNSTTKKETAAPSSGAATPSGSTSGAAAS